MSKKRDRLEIIYTILKIIQDKNNSIRPTPLLRYTNVSSQSFKEYYDELLQKKFIRKIEDKKGKKTISLTDKGFRFIEKYSYILGFIEEFEL